VLAVARAAAPLNAEPEFVTCRYPSDPYPRWPTGNRPKLRPDGMLVLDATSASKCGEAAAVPVVPGATYRMSADYYGQFGHTPRICLREVPSGRCAQTPDLTRVGSWQTVRALVRPLRDTT